jgi:hypothetical protein
VNRKWQLASEKPGLFYKKKNSKIAEKVGVDEKGDVTVAEDSPMAEENLRKNLAKVERVRKRKAAEAAGHAPGEKEKQEAKTPPVEEEEAEAKGPEAILKALRKKKAAKPAAAIETEAETEPAEKPEAGAATEDEGSPARKKLEQLRRARKARGAKAEAPEETLAEEAAEEPRAA